MWASLVCFKLWELATPVQIWASPFIIMASKTKKIQAFGKFKAGYGIRVRNSYNKIESLQRKKQKSPHSKGRAKRIASGIWKDLKTGRVFAGPAYVLENK